METTARGNTPSTPGMPGNGEDTLHKASSSAHAAVNSIADAAEEAARKGSWNISYRHLRLIRRWTRRLALRHRRPTG